MMFSVTNLKAFSSAITMELSSSSPKVNYNLVKKSAQFCEVVEVDVVHEQLGLVGDKQEEDDPTIPGRASLLLRGQDELANVIDNIGRR